MSESSLASIVGVDGRADVDDGVVHHGAGTDDCAVEDTLARTSAPASTVTSRPSTLRSTVPCDHDTGAEQRVATLGAGIDVAPGRR